MRSVAGVVIAICLGGCAATAGDPDDAHQPTRAIWGIVPDPPARKADLRPAMIRGTAVAVAENALLAACAATLGREQVGLVRHNKLRLAQVTRDEGSQICRLTVSTGPLSSATSYRSFADMHVGEPVIALASRAADDILLASGWLAGKGDPSDPFLETTVVLPPTRSAVLVDGSGNLLGLGAVADVAEATMMVVPIEPALAPTLANRDLGVLWPVLAGAVANPRAQPAQPALLITLGTDRDGPDRTRFGPTRDDPRIAADTTESRSGTSGGQPASAGNAGASTNSGNPSGSSGGTDAPGSDAGPAAGPPNDSPAPSAEHGNRGRAEGHSEGQGQSGDDDHSNGRNRGGHGRGDR
jgi:hypothetical protein